MPAAPRVLFLPGAAGAREFWSPVTQRLPADWEKVTLSWPGLGDQPHEPSVSGFDDLVALVAAALTRRCDLVAQSMGGLIAAGVAARYPEKVGRLVLVATSGGFDISEHHARDWREDYARTYPGSARWITETMAEQQPALTGVTAPTLLLWGDRDPISPVTVGRRLARLLPNATLRVIAGATHSLAFDEPDLVAALIAEHLGAHDLSPMSRPDAR